ncbi:DUF2726 domain-containing protein [Paenibacillus sp. AK121]|uniref:DUF2726 domain-containing protein n=1 Tax=Paenibacillus sp. AK121 TaxID=2849670 RepID=UPI001C24A932|nr:DUF2726 domain-containing protein [Paenibacillus sp. AK121]MBU9707134.1 DUF2726 domain-containing protein [Paenibacillus sp. AK121]
MPRYFDHQMFLERVAILGNGEYTVLGEYKKAKEKVLIKHNICGHEYLVEPDKFLAGRRCPVCADKNRHVRRRLPLEEVKRRMFERAGDEFSIVGEYNGRAKHTTLKHNVCGHVWGARIDNFLELGRRCPKCGVKRRGLKRRLTQEQFEEKFQSALGDEYEPLEPYVTDKRKIKVLHKGCGTVFLAPPMTLWKGHGCPVCRKSKGELKIVNFLNDANIEYIPQYSFDNLKYKLKLNFDFAVFKDEKLMCLVEYDGEQHFQPVKAFGGKEGFAKVKKRDQLKDQYCKENEIKLIRIPFTQFDNIEGILERELKILSK